jgi:vacuolar-type H+-ATPase subunit F/Vma7
MAAPVYLGDEATAAGFRLAGVRAIVAPAGDASVAFGEACRDASLVIVCASVVARLPDAVVARARSNPALLVAVIPDLHGEAPLPDAAAWIYAELGLEAP